MFNDTTTIIYQLLLCSCLIIAIIKRKQNPFPIYIYFLLVLIIEYIASVETTTSLPYQLASLFYAVFFTVYYAHFTQKLKKEIYLIGGTGFVIILFFVLKFEQNFPTAIGIVIAVLYLILSLLWFYDQIKRPGKAFIITKQLFWVSTANLFWSIVFIFRISLMYWLAEKDLPFLIFIDKIFKVSLILSYLLLLIGVTKKQDPIHE